MTREEILKHVEDEEFKVRCFAVNICPYCGGERKDLANPNPYLTRAKRMFCINKDCDGVLKQRVGGSHG